jgi:hypothetical protein
MLRRVTQPPHIAGPLVVMGIRFFVIHFLYISTLTFFP